MLEFHVVHIILNWKLEFRLEIEIENWKQKIRKEKEKEKTSLGPIRFFPSQPISPFSLHPR